MANEVGAGGENCGCQTKPGADGRAAVGPHAVDDLLCFLAGRGIGDGAVAFGDLLRPTINTAGIALVTAILTVVVVLPIAVETTRRPGPLTTIAAGAVLGGFAIPGLVIALALAVLALNVTGVGWLYQSLALLVIGYIVHFGSQALASTERKIATPRRPVWQTFAAHPAFGASLAAACVAVVFVVNRQPAGLSDEAGAETVVTLVETPATAVTPLAVAQVPAATPSTKQVAPAKFEYQPAFAATGLGVVRNAREAEIAAADKDALEWMQRVDALPIASRVLADPCRRGAAARGVRFVGSAGHLGSVASGRWRRSPPRPSGRPTAPR